MWGYPGTLARDWSPRQGDTGWGEHKQAGVGLGDPRQCGCGGTWACWHGVGGPRQGGVGAPGHAGMGSERQAG